MNSEEKYTQKISVFEKAAILTSGLGNFPLFALMSSFLTYFYTNVIGLDPGAIGIILLISRLLDGVSDIIFGNIIDKTRTSKGVCRPWIFRCAFLIALAIVMLFTVPNGSTGLKLAYVFITYNLSSVVIYTISTTAVVSLPTYITRNPRQQTLLYALNNFGVGIANVTITTFTLKFVRYFGNDQKAWIIVVCIYAILSACFLFYTGAASKEYVDPDEVSKGKAKESLAVSLKCSLQNKYWFLMLGIIILGVGVFGTSLQMHTYYAQYILGNVELAGKMNSAYTIPSLFVGFLIVSFGQYVNRKKAVIGSCALQLVGCVLIVFAPTSMPILIFASVIKGIGYGGVMGFKNAMLAASIEYGQWKTGVRSQAIFMAANGFGQKVGGGIITAAIGGIMSLTGFNGMAESLSTQALGGIRSHYIFMPIILTVLELIFIMMYDLDKKYDGIIKDLAEGKTAISQQSE